VDGGGRRGGRGGRRGGAQTLQLLRPHASKSARWQLEPWRCGRRGY